VTVNNVSNSPLSLSPHCPCCNHPVSSDRKQLFVSKTAMVHDWNGVVEGIHKRTAILLFVAASFWNVQTRWESIITKNNWFKWLKHAPSFSHSFPGTDGIRQERFQRNLLWTRWFREANIPSSLSPSLPSSLPSSLTFRGDRHERRQC